MDDSFAKITAIIVSYNTPVKNIENIATIIGQVDNIVIIDNGSGPETIKALDDFSSLHDNVNVIFNGKNIGLASAQNIGISYATDKKSHWVLLLDDDSIASDDMVSHMQSAYNSHDNKNDIAIIAPYIDDCNVQQNQRYVTKNGIFFKRVSFSEQLKIIEPLAVIASGSMVKLSVIEKIGNMRDDFFIDYIDTEFALRAIASGYKIIVVADAILKHNLGAKTEHKFMGLRVITSNHSPKRRYTIARNRVVTWKKYIFKTPQYIFYDMLAAKYDIVRIICCEEQKFQKVYSILSGALRGFLYANSTPSQ